MEKQTESLRAVANFDHGTAHKQQSCRVYSFVSESSQRLTCTHTSSRECMTALHLMQIQAKSEAVAAAWQKIEVQRTELDSQQQQLAQQTKQIDEQTR